MPDPRPPATIIAFDGLLVDTRDARRLAVSIALDAESIAVASEIIDALLPGRSLDEAVIAAIDSSVEQGGHTIDHTQRDLAVMRARRALSAIVARGLPLVPGASDWLASRAATAGRVIVRADSIRADVERMLEFSGLTDSIWLLRCADDPPRAFTSTSIERSWNAIALRLRSYGVSLASCAAFECDPYSAGIARTYTSHVHQLLLLTTTS